MTKRRAVVVGAGHNGLVAACYLARGGMEVTVLERRGIVGGMCVTEELFKGVKVSSLACRHGMLRRKIIDDLHLEAHGLQGYRGDYASHIFSDGSCLNMDFATREGRVQSSAGKIAVEDLAAWEAFWAEIGVASRILSGQQENGGLTQAGYQDLLREKGLPELAEIVFTATLLEFAKLRLGTGAFAAAACASNFGHACQAGSLFEMIYLDTAESFAEFGQWGYAVGGMGAVTQALLKEAQALGVVVKCDAEVDELVKLGKELVVKMKDGSDLQAEVVVVGTDPYTLYKHLLRREVLPEDLVDKVEGMVEDISKAIVHLRLRELPKIPVLAASGRDGVRQFAGQIDFTLTVAELEAGWRKFEETGRFGAKMNLATNMLTAMDETLCETGQVWTVVHFFCPSRYNGGDWTVGARGELLEDTLEVLRAQVPEIDELVVDYHMITPTDLRDTYGVRTFTPLHVGFDGAHVLENRPVAGYGGYRTPVAGVYMCGSGANPGAMVTGMPGMLCAQTVLGDLA